MMKKKIHNFTIEGVIGDEKDIIRMRDVHERHLLASMRDQGYVPILDLAPQFSLDYLEKSQTFHFELTMFGVYVGKKRAWEIEGFSGQAFYNKA